MREEPGLKKCLLGHLSSTSRKIAKVDLLPQYLVEINLLCRDWNWQTKRDGQESGQVTEKTEKEK